MKRISLLITALLLASCAQHPDPVVHHQGQNIEKVREQSALRASRSLFRYPPPPPQIGTALVIKKAPAKPKHKKQVGHMPHLVVPKGELQAYAARLVGASQFGCVDAIFSRESHWNPKARNHRSGAYGIPQRIHPPANWTNPFVQIKWGIDYMNNRYGSPCEAWSFWQSNHWY